MIKMKLLKPITWEADEPIRFQCQEESCGDIVTSNRIFAHAKAMHHSEVVQMDASMGDWLIPKDFSYRAEVHA